MSKKMKEIMAAVGFAAGVSGHSGQPVETHVKKINRDEEIAHTIETDPLEKAAKQMDQSGIKVDNEKV